MKKANVFYNIELRHWVDGSGYSHTETIDTDSERKDLQEFVNCWMETENINDYSNFVFELYECIENESGYVDVNLLETIRIK